MHKSPRTRSKDWALALPSAPITSFSSTHKFTVANIPLRIGDRGSHTWKEDCFALYLQQNVRKSKLLTIINNWGENPQNSHKMTQKDGVCEGHLLFALLGVCNTVHSKAWSFGGGSGVSTH